MLRTLTLFTSVAAIVLIASAAEDATGHRNRTYSTQLSVAGTMGKKAAWQ
jgi:hypothetical protein